MTAEPKRISDYNACTSPAANNLLLVQGNALANYFKVDITTLFGNSNVSFYVAPSQNLSVNTFILRNRSTPANGTVGTQGVLSYDTNNIYLSTNNNITKKVPLLSFSSLGYDANSIAWDGSALGASPAISTVQGGLDYLAENGSANLLTLGVVEGGMEVTFLAGVASYEETDYSVLIDYDDIVDIASTQAITGVKSFVNVSANVFVANTVANTRLINYAETYTNYGSSGGGTENINAASGTIFRSVVDTSTVTYTFTNPHTTGTTSFTLILVNGGSQTVVWPATVRWPAGVAPTLTASGTDVLVFTTFDAGTSWYGFPAGLAMSVPA